MLTIRMKIVIAIIVVATLFALGFCVDETEFWQRYLWTNKHIYPSRFDILTWVDGWKWYLANRLDQGVIMGIGYNIPSMFLVPLAWYAWEDISYSSHKVETATDLLFKAFCFVLAMAVACVIVYIAFCILALLFG